MLTSQVNPRFEHILELVKELPEREKVLLSKELEKDIMGSKLTELLKTFSTDELSLDTIEEEVEFVRQSIYDNLKH